VNEVCANILKHKLLDEVGIRSLIDTFYGKHSVGALTSQVLREASHLREHLSLSYWDSTIVAAALASGAGVLLSEDMHDGLIVREQLTIVNPFK
jgi:predicted nucleic acid-binding protein